MQLKQMERTAEVKGGGFVFCLVSAMIRLQVNKISDACDVQNQRVMRPGCWKNWKRPRASSHIWKRFGTMIEVAESERCWL